MSATNDEVIMTSAQIKKQLKSVQINDSDIKHRLINLIEEFQCLDKIAHSIGLAKQGFSFVNRVSWKNIFAAIDKTEEDSTADQVKLKDVIDAVSQSSDQLQNELIPQVQKIRNSWMGQVILFEIVLLGLLTAVMAGVIYLKGISDVSGVSILIQSFLYERPVFSLILVGCTLLCFLVMHFSIRKFVANQFVKKLNRQHSEFDLAAAFLKNTRIQHSIFRPEIIGWGWLNKRCLMKNAHSAE